MNIWMTAFRDECGLGRGVRVSSRDLQLESEATVLVRSVGRTQNERLPRPKIGFIYGVQLDFLWNIWLFCLMCRLHFPNFHPFLVEALSHFLWIFLVFFFRACFTRLFFFLVGLNTRRSQPSGSCFFFLGWRLPPPPLHQQGRQHLPPPQLLPWSQQPLSQPPLLHLPPPALSFPARSLLQVPRSRQLRAGKIFPWRLLRPILLVAYQVLPIGSSTR